jgi:rare lipoprotein A
MRVAGGLASGRLRGHDPGRAVVGPQGASRWDERDPRTRELLGEVPRRRRRGWRGGLTPARSAAPLPRRALLAALALAAACAHAPPREPGPRDGREEREAPRTPGRADEQAEEGEVGPAVGLASFYGRRFHGRRTASGDRYDMHAFTCAHRTAPFGTRLRVTELETGRSVVVVVNDRGPFVRGRVVDVSLAAARALGIVGRGIARVRIERLPEGSRRAARSITPSAARARRRPAAR